MNVINIESLYIIKNKKFLGLTPSDWESITEFLYDIGLLNKGAVFNSKHYYTEMTTDTSKPDMIIKEGSIIVLYRALFIEENQAIELPVTDLVGVMSYKKAIPLLEKGKRLVVADGSSWRVFDKDTQFTVNSLFKLYTNELELCLPWEHIHPRYLSAYLYGENKLLLSTKRKECKDEYNNMTDVLIYNIFENNINPVDYDDSLISYRPSSQ